jgi:ferredoxin-NADP reductase
VDGALVARLVPERKAHYYLCGPVPFMAAIQSDLERRGVDPDHIHTESFGPRTTAATAPGAQVYEPARAERPG